MWIFIAQDIFPGALSQLEKLVDTGKLTILVPEQVKEEWDNGKADKVRSHYKNGIKGALTNSKNLKEYLSGEDRKVLEGLIESVNRKKDEYAVDKANEYISRVEELIKKGDTCPTTNDNKIKAFEMGIAKKAPFHKKDSFGDAVIVLSTVKHLQEHEIKKAYFITGNKNDFGEPGNESELHPDLKGLFESVELQYSINVKEIFRLIDEMIVTVEEVQEVERINKEMYVPEDPKCPVCDKTMQGAYLRSQYGGLTLQWFCPTGHFKMDTGEFWD
jgi:hypothetical protein